MNAIASFLENMVSPSQAQVLIYLCAANLLSGVVVALAKGKFELVQLKDFWKRIGVVFGAYLTVAIASKVIADFEAMRTIAWATLVLYLTAKIVGNLKDLGLPVPDSLQKWIERTP